MPPQNWPAREKVVVKACVNPISAPRRRRLSCPLAKFATDSRTGSSCDSTMRCDSAQVRGRVELNGEFRKLTHQTMSPVRSKENFRIDNASQKFQLHKKKRVDCLHACVETANSSSL